MSVKAVTWALEQRISDPRAHLLLINLANFADDKHKCFPGQPLLAERIGRSVDTVQRLLKKLNDLGFIESERRNSSLGYRSSNLYRLNIEVSVGLIPPTSSAPNPRPQNHGKGNKSQGRKSAEPKPQQDAEPKPHLGAVGTINNHQEPSSPAGAMKKVSDLESEVKAIEALGKPRIQRNRPRLTILTDSPQGKAWFEHWDSAGREDLIALAVEHGSFQECSLWPPSTGAST